MTALRHLLSILLLPFLVVIVVPAWLLNTYATGERDWSNVAGVVWLVRFAGGALFAVGLGVFFWCVSLFASVGRGTLAPWDPARNFVAVGPYRYVRNPMISGVALMLSGQAMFWGSGVLGAWAGAFVLINHVYFILSEEPGLERRFGEKYRRYKANVPRWIPQLKPWSNS